MSAAGSTQNAVPAAPSQRYSPAADSVLAAIGSTSGESPSPKP